MSKKSSEKQTRVDRDEIKMKEFIKFVFEVMLKDQKKGKLLHFDRREVRNVQQ